MEISRESKQYNFQNVENRRRDPGSELDIPSPPTA